MKCVVVPPVFTWFGLESPRVEAESLHSKHLLTGSIQIYCGGVQSPNAENCVTVQIFMGLTVYIVFIQSIYKYTSYVHPPNAIMKGCLQAHNSRSHCGSQDHHLLYISVVLMPVLPHCIIYEWVFPLWSLLLSNDQLSNWSTNISHNEISFYGPTAQPNEWE